MLECIVLNQIELVFKLLKLTFKKVKSSFNRDSQVLIAFANECVPDISCFREFAFAFPKTQYIFRKLHVNFSGLS